MYCSTVLAIVSRIHGPRNSFKQMGKLKIISALIMETRKHRGKFVR